MKVVDLRSELGALGLDTKGNKPALVERLKKALEAKTGKGKSYLNMISITFNVCLTSFVFSSHLIRKFCDDRHV